ncbi:hypothetical protein B0H67DRAFT_552153 [Lasiosphaeris hirsuta]|uniref:Uncharacterized protein n=1 Tax=Lasiosphaeris hirsuta TaxID=260670 RepID=A0AA40AQ17_9PEZI|nr:hypothetical protein B0H67DRAFT_552153 [Lasiosphaeris hirsuta]
MPTLAPLVRYFNERTRNAGWTSGGGSKRAGDVGSRYAMQTWKSGRAKGHQLDGEHDDTDLNSFEGHVSKGNSSENILESGITKKMDVTITRVEASRVALALPPACGLIPVSQTPEAARNPTWKLAAGVQCGSLPT